MTTEETTRDESLSISFETGLPRRTETRREQVIGHMTIHHEPDLHVRIERDGEQALCVRLPGAALERALLFDDALAKVTVIVTLLDGAEVDRIVGVVNPGEQMTGREFAQALRDLFDSEEEKQNFLDSFDDFWPNESDE